MRTRFIPTFARTLRADPLTLARELQSVVTADEHEFSSDASRDAYADVLRALGNFMHRSAFEAALVDVAGETFRPLATRAVCNYCGSDDLARDASARWDEVRGEWTLAGVYDDQTCETCGADGSNLVAYLPVAPAAGARVRIKSRQRIGGDPFAGRTGTVVRPNRVAQGLYVRLDPRPREHIEKVELVGLDDLELACPSALMDRDHR